MAKTALTDASEGVIIVKAYEKKNSLAECAYLVKDWIDDGNVTFQRRKNNHVSRG